MYCNRPHKIDDSSYFLTVSVGVDVYKRQEGYSVNKVLSSAPMILAFNMDEGQMFDGNLARRQAICYAINQEDIIAGGLRGNGEAIRDLGDKLCGDYNPDWNNEDYYDFDLNQAKAMLDEAGSVSYTHLRIRILKKGRKAH